LVVQTDIICGFPNETEEDFQKTLDLISSYKFGAVNISQFYPRPGTPAAKMRRIPTQIVKDRSRRLTRLFESFTPYTHLPGRRMKVWFNTEVSDDGSQSVGHTKSYVKVLVPHDASLPGKSRWVDVLKCQRFHIEGVISADQTESPNVQGLPDYRTLDENNETRQTDLSTETKTAVAVGQSQHGNHHDPETLADNFAINKEESGRKGNKESEDFAIRYRTYLQLSATAAVVLASIFIVRRVRKR
jgi:threonylcarbamoyladenosine tRNA methylthiotransferase CDKAL1